MDSGVDAGVATVLGGVLHITAGGSHSCGDTDGGLTCWGWNAYGQIGINSTAMYASKAVVVPGAMHGVSAGAVHTCALTPAGGVKCWGSNTGGQIGNNTMSVTLTPVDVIGLGSGVQQVSSGGVHTCALLNSGGVSCWGLNADGQLGDNSTVTSPVPVVVPTLTTGVRSIAVGGQHSCALMTAGGVKCWGSNFDGQVGNNSAVSVTAPVDVIGLTSGVARIAAGKLHTCAVLSTGAVKCWGRNTNGQLGDNLVTIHSPVPVDVVGLGSGVSTVVGGGDHSCAILTTGAVKCWGDNLYGQLGTGMNSNALRLSRVPVDVVGLTSGVIGLAAGDQHQCALLAAGTVKCWGENDRANLGNDAFVGSTVPVDVLR